MFNAWVKTQLVRSAGSQRSGGTMPAGVAGYSLLEVLFVTALGVVMIGIAIPAVNEARQRLQMRAAIQEVAQTVRAARLRSVTTGRTIRLRFNCPGNGQYRAVEWTGDAAIDNAADRCAAAAYPYPDLTPAAVPNVDGPVVDLGPGLSFSAATDMIVSPNGRIAPTTGASPVTMTVSNGRTTQTFTVSASGRIGLP